MRTLATDTEVAKVAVDALIDFVNGWNPEDLAKIMLDRVTHSHRTLQQSFFGAMKLMIEQYGALDPSMWTDMRNQSAHHWAQLVAKAEREVGRDGIRFPHI